MRGQWPEMVYNMKKVCHIHGNSRIMIWKRYIINRNDLFKGNHLGNHVLLSNMVGVLHMSQKGDWAHFDWQPMTNRVLRYPICRQTRSGDITSRREPQQSDIQRWTSMGDVSWWNTAMEATEQGDVWFMLLPVCVWTLSISVCRPACLSLCL